MRLFALIGGLIVLVLVAALAAPPLIDWTTFRTEFEREASRALGQPVRVRGDTSLRLLPLPKVTFETVAVGDDAGGALLTADQFELTMELAPLLTGQVRIVDTALVGGDLTLRLREDGSLDWLETSTGSPGVSAEQISIERLAVRDSAITLLRTGDAAPLELRDVDVELTARRLSGPWRGEGEFALGDERYRVTASTGAFRTTPDAKELSARVTLRPRSLPFDVSVAGPVRLTGSTVSATGTFSVDPAGRVLPTMSAAETAFAEARPRDGLPVRTVGAFDLKPDALEVSNLEVSVGAGDDPYRVTGSGRVALSDAPRFTLDLEGSRIDADRLVATKVEAGDQDVQSRLTALRRVLTKLPRPRMPGRVELYLPAVALGDTLVREVDLAAEPDAVVDRWDIRKLEALLPGRTALEATGIMSVGDEDGGLGFDGRVLVASRQPSGLARWLGADATADDAIRRLRSAGLAGRLQFGDGRARLDEMELRLGPDLLRGTVARVTALDGTRPRLLAELEGTGLQADPALALFSLLTRSDAEDAMATHDVDLRLAVERLSYRDVDAREVDTVLSYRSDGLRVDRLRVGGVEGFAVEVAGRLNDPYGRASGRLSGTVRVVDANAVMAFARRRIDVPEALRHLVRDGALLAGSELTGSFDAQPAATGSATTLNLAGSLGTSEIEAVIAADGDATNLDALALDVTVQARNGEAGDLLRLLGLDPGFQAMGEAGRFLFRGRGRLGGALESDASLGVGASEMAFSGTTTPSQGAAEGALNVSGDDVSVLMNAFGLGLAGLNASIGAEVAGELAAAPDRLTFDAIEARVGNGVYGGALALDRTTRPRPTLSGTLTANALDLETLIELAVGPGSAIADVRSDDTPFGPAWLSGYDGSIRVEASEMALDLGLFAPAPATGVAGAITLDDGALAIEIDRARWLGGMASGRASMARTQNAATFAMSLRLSDSDLAATELFDPDRPALAGRFDLEVDAQGQGSTRAEIVARVSGGGVLKVRNATLRGLRSDALASVQTDADALEDAALEEAARAVFARNALSGAVDYDAVAVPFAIAAGTLRTGGVDLSTGDLNASASARVDLNSGAVDGQLRGRFAAGEDAPQGVTPAFTIAMRGTLEAPAVSFDSTATTTFLTTRLRERREREFAAQRAAILERQRLARETRLIVLRDRARQRAEERARQRAVEEAARATEAQTSETEPQEAL